MGLIPGSVFAAAGDSKIRPFKVNVPEADIADLRRRIAATRWPGKETVADESQGVRLVRMQALAQYWGTDYDWRKGEAKLNALPMFMTEIDGLDIQFIHVRSRHKNALPLIMTHGWPGSISNSSRSSGRSPTPPLIAEAPTTRFTSSCRHCRASASPDNRRQPAGARTTSLARGAS
jgi:hypothetical protein